MEQPLSPGETIAVGLDEEGSSWPALEFAVREAERAGARLQLVHAHDVPRPGVRPPSSTLLTPASAA